MWITINSFLGPYTMITLGIETSCDDTSAAVLENEGVVRSNVVSSQDHIHQRFGGIVPELASRKHMEHITLVVEKALADAGTSLGQVNLIAVTQGPGLIGSLLVGFSYAKALSFTQGIPFVGVDHMTGHILSVFLEEQVVRFPYVALIVSGGTTALYRVTGFSGFSLLGRTRDDAAGEAFDKVARLLNLGYPGGPFISLAAEGGDPKGLDFPRAWLAEDSFDFSFSGLKTAVMNHCNQCRVKNLPLEINTICSSFQEAVVEVLSEKAIAATKASGTDRLVLGGGVSANRRLREYLQHRCQEESIELYLSSAEYCTDNAAMIAFAGLMKFRSGVKNNVNDDVFSRSHLGQ